MWRSKESRSGRGSELEHTENLRKELPELVKKYQVSTLLDAPCGDFRWMQHVLPEMRVNYIGGEIVYDLVERNSREFGTGNVSFRHIDITKDQLPAADLMIVRDCLFHLPVKEIYHFLTNFCDSTIDLLLTTSHIHSGGKNHDIKVGEFRYLYLFLEPFSFPIDPLERIMESDQPPIKREMCLFSKKQVKIARDNLHNAVAIDVMDAPCESAE